MTTGRPPLTRHVVTLEVTVELGAADPDDAFDRALTLAFVVEPRLAATIRNHRTGSPVVTATTVRLPAPS